MAIAVVVGVLLALLIWHLEDTFSRGGFWSGITELAWISGGLCATVLLVWFTVGL